MPPENEVSLRDTLESAFDEHEEQAGGSSEDASQSVRVPAEAAAPSAVTPIPSEDRGDGRRVDGKFARKAVDAAAAGTERAAAVPAAGTAAVTAAPADVPKAVDQYGRAPQSWKPGAREAWGQLPPDVRAEVYRRERETQRVVAETAQARQVASHVESLSQKFAPALQAEGVDVIKATENLMNLASRLRFGTSNEKAQLAAQIIRSYGVDIAQLDQVLSNAGPLPQQQPQMMTDPRVDTLLAQLQDITAKKQQAIVQTAVGEVESFGGDKEFFEDVRADMADLMEVAARRGIDLTLEQAYERACAMQPEIHKVLTAREAAKLAGNSNQSTLRARHAASSVRGTPTGMPSSQPNDLRGAIEAAIETVGGR